MDDNKDAVERRILSTLSQLLEVESALDDWAASNAEEPRGIREFKRCCIPLYCGRTSQVTIAQDCRGRTGEAEASQGAVPFQKVCNTGGR